MNRPARGRRSADGEDETFVMTRAEDRSIFLQIAYYLEKYKIIVWAVVGLALAIGFDFKTPRAIVQGLQAQITENKKQVDSTLTPRVDRLDSKLDILLRLRCGDTSITALMKNVSGLSEYCLNQQGGSRGLR